jgi:transposase
VVDAYNNQQNSQQQIAKTFGVSWKLISGSIKQYSSSRTTFANIIAPK